MSNHITVRSPQTKPGSDEWLADRLNGIGSSDIASAATESMGGAHKVIAERIGDPIPASEEINPEYAARGHEWEERIGDGVKADTGLHLAGEQLMVEHPENRRWTATLDGLLIPTKRARFADVMAVAEFKTMIDFAPWRWEYWYTQCQWQMMVTGVPLACLVVCRITEDPWGHETIGRRNMSWIKADDDYQSNLVTLATRIWRHVKTGDYPPISGESLPWVRARFAAGADADRVNLDSIEDVIRANADLKTAEKAAIAERKGNEATIREAVGNALGGECTGGWPRVNVGKQVRKWHPADVASFMVDYAADIAENDLLDENGQLDKRRARLKMPAEVERYLTPTEDRRMTIKLEE